MVQIDSTSRQNVNITSLRIRCLLMNGCQWVVDVILLQTPSRLQRLMPEPFR